MSIQTGPVEAILLTMIEIPFSSLSLETSLITGFLNHNEGIKNPGGIWRTELAV